MAAVKYQLCFAKVYHNLRRNNNNSSAVLCSPSTRSHTRSLENEPGQHSAPAHTRQIAFEFVLVNLLEYPAGGPFNESANHEIMCKLAHMVLLLELQLEAE